MPAIIVSITNDDADNSVTLKQVKHNAAEGNLDPHTAVIVLEPGAGTAITILDASVLVVRENSTADLPVNTSVAHQTGETTTTVASPE